MNSKSIIALKFALLFICVISAQDTGKDEFDDNDEASVEEEQWIEPPAVDVYYESPIIDDPRKVYLAEHFDNADEVNKKWIRSKAMKEGVAEDIAKYNGEWKVEGAIKDSLPNDLGLVLKSKAAHAAISAPLSRPFIFDKKPLIVQYEVILQDGQECGGAYLKLLSQGKASENLEQFTDKTPYTIMFGPDKCGNDHKLHFIFKHRNPLNGSLEEKHCKKPKDRLEDIYKDKMPHLYTLVLNPDNTYEIRIDKSVVNSGSLLADFTPSVNPPAEIDDPTDKKPEDWDEREKIPDPDATKPDDWNEDAPSQIPDESVIKPDGWLDDEPETIPDPDAVKPADWDLELDGEWEAPMIDNPKCLDTPGCGPWKAPMVFNPEYKGQWRAPMIDNPNYKGKWRAKKIPNPDFFEDKHPFRMDPISAIGFEIWSMSKDILFDNLIITDELIVAEEWATVTFDLKRQKIAKDAESVITKLLNMAEENPYMWAVYIIVVSLPVIVIIVLCCRPSSPSRTPEQEVLLRQSAERKKTDSMTEEDPVFVDEKNEDEEEDKDASDKEKNSDTEDEDEADQEEAQDVPPPSQGEGDVPRKRRVRKE